MLNILLKLEVYVNSYIGLSVYSIFTSTATEADLSKKNPLGWTPENLRTNEKDHPPKLARPSIYGQDWPIGLTATI